MRLRTRVSCVTVIAIGVSSLASLVAGCVGDDNVAPSGDSGVDSTVNEPETSTPAPDAGQDTGTDAGPSDAGQDSPVVDTGVDAGCSPSLPSGWAPPAYVPAVGHYLNDCIYGPPQIAGEWTACFGDASTPATCAAYVADGGNQSCASCLVTPEDSGAYGAAILGPVPIWNVAGCIQIGDPTDAGLGCATAIQASEACAEAACRASCPVTSDPASAAAFSACAASALKSAACSAWATPAASCLGAEMDAGGQVINCFATTAEQAFDDIGVFFCGS